jgi:hypothetical protein
MLNKKHLIWAVLVVLALAFPLAGCGDDDDDDDDLPAVGDDDTTADDDDTPPSDDDTPGGDDDDDTTPGDDDTTPGDDDDDDDDDDDNNDDDATPDDYLAPWPQANIEPDDYDETGTAGSLRVKAKDYDDWHVYAHQPYYGGTVNAYFSDETRTTPTGYGGFSDSCIWTGTYLASQAMRFQVTDEIEARDNVLAMVATLHGYLHVNGITGFISRYWAPQTALHYGGDEWCEQQDRCHAVETGEYAGDWWWGETSRDQYTGWFFGLAMAFDLVEDETMRATIRADVTEVLDALIDQNWWILDEEGLPTDAAPNILPIFRVAWLAIGYHVTGLDRFKTELAEWTLNENRLKLRASSIAFLNRYGQYYGNNLSHTNWYNILRLGKAYFSAEDYAFYLQLFESQVHTFTRLSHNPWFNGVFMGQGDYTPGAKDDPYQAQLFEDLTTLADPPHAYYHLPARDPSTYELDPVSVALHDLQVQYPFLEELIGGIDYQALNAFPVDQQCSKDFRFQKSPFLIEECGTDAPTSVYPGVDYLIAYWLANYHKYVDKTL